MQGSPLSSGRYAPKSQYKDVIGRTLGVETELREEAREKGVKEKENGSKGTKIRSRIRDGELKEVLEVASDSILL